MSDYRVIYADILTGTRQGELDFQSLTWGHELNGAGSCTITVPLNPVPSRSGAAHPGYTTTNLRPGTTTLYVLRDNVPVWSGIIWTAQANPGSNLLTLGARGWLSYFERLHITQKLAYGTTSSPVDQTSVIFKGLIDSAQSKPGAVELVDTSTITASGKLRRRFYNPADLVTYAEAMESFGDIYNGFDFRFQARVSSGDFVVECFTRYPNRGRSTQFVFELGGNVTLLDYSESATNVANKVIAVPRGAGGDNWRGRVVVTDGASLADYPLMERVVDVGETRSSTGIEDKAERALGRSTTPATNITLQTTSDTVPNLGSYEVGDKVRVRGSYGWLDIDLTARIVGYSVAVGAVENVTLDLVPLRLFK